MDLICYLHPGWRPLIRPASPKRDWMDGTPESYAYRCLPLNIANAHGWEVLSPCAFEARWNGGAGVGNVEIRLAEGADPARAPVSLFGSGTITFHIEGLFRTEPGWNLWVGGSPNLQKDGIQALTGVVETDWSPFTFTMNWRFTRPNQWVTFEAGEPICFFFPVQRGVLDAVTPTFADIDADPEAKAQFQAWSAARNAFHEKMAQTASAAPTDRWQKHYYRGVRVDETPGAADHQSKLRLQPFKGLPEPGEMALQTLPPRPPEPAAGSEAAELALSKRDWLLQSLEAQRRLAPDGLTIERRGGISREEFLARYYAPARPVILTGETANWPALYLWTPQYLREVVGDKPIEFQGGRAADPLFEMYKDGHKRQAPFNAYMDAITSQAGNDAYITAYNSSANRDALSVLDKDLGLIDKILAPTADPHAMKWIGPEGTVTSLHHDLTNNLIVQAVGAKRVRLTAAADVGRMYNSTHVFSDVRTFDNPVATIANFPALEGLTVYEVVLQPGEALFVPLGWWHEVKSLTFSVTLTYTNFLWPNEAYQGYPT